MPDRQHLDGRSNSTVPWLKKVSGTLRHQFLLAYSDASKVPDTLFNACVSRDVSGSKFTVSIRYLWNCSESVEISSTC